MAARFTTPASIDAALADADRAVRAASTSAIPPRDSAAGPPIPAMSTELASAAIDRETTIDEAARRQAMDLRAVPGIERFGAVRLAELDSAGPRPLRTMWRVAREQLGDRFGQATIGELIDRYAGPRSPGRS
jgi:hypothetical protein